MIEQSLLEYDFDEEVGFAEPPKHEAEHAGLSGGEKFSLALVGIGLISLIVQIAGGPLAGTWTGFFSSIGLISFGASLAFWFGQRNTQPGIKHDGIFFNSLLARGSLAWVAGILMTGFYVLIYWYPEYLGYQSPTWDADGNVIEPGKISGLVRVVDPLAHFFQGGPASQWFLYGVLYCLAIVVFGVRMVMKYRHNRYHQIRTASVTFFQLGFAFLLPNILVRFQKPYMEFNGAWPLKYDYLWPNKIHEFWNEPSGIGTFLLFWSIVLALVATPVLTYFYGKRWYCSWVCGCGGLAETLGDPFRQLSDKSTRAWKIERWMIHLVLVAVLVVTGLLWGNELTDGAWFGDAYKFKQWYGFYIGAVFSGVVGVGFYPLLGNRVWCRFGCPQAAILGLIQRLWSRFRITANGDQCMSCGNCSTYCEMGIDVRAYAQSGANIIRASCVGCGVCAAVCPRGVLKLENGMKIDDRYDGADTPVSALLASIKNGPTVP